MSDPDRFEELVLPHLDAAYNLARWLTRDTHDAEDVVQDACLRALKYVASLHGTDARGWFLTIVRNAFYDWLARNRPAEVTHDENDSIDAAIDYAAATPEQAIGTCSGKVFTASALRMFRVSTLCDHADDETIVICRAVQTLLRKTLWTPAP